MMRIWQARGRKIGTRYRDKPQITTSLLCEKDWKVLPPAQNAFSWLLWNIQQHSTYSRSNNVSRIKTNF
jgi:hypothetical protein